MSTLTPHSSHCESKRTFQIVPDGYLSAFRSCFLLTREGIKAIQFRLQSCCFCSESMGTLLAKVNTGLEMADLSRFSSAGLPKGAGDTSLAPRSVFWAYCWTRVSEASQPAVGGRRGLWPDRAEPLGSRDGRQVAAELRERVCKVTVSRQEGPPLTPCPCLHSGSQILCS